MALTSPPQVADDPRPTGVTYIFTFWNAGKTPARIVSVHVTAKKLLVDTLDNPLNNDLGFIVDRTYHPNHVVPPEGRMISPDIDVTAARFIEGGGVVGAAFKCSVTYEGVGFAGERFETEAAFTARYGIEYGADPGQTRMAPLDPPVGDPQYLPDESRMI